MEPAAPQVCLYCSRKAARRACPTVNRYLGCESRPRTRRRAACRGPGGHSPPRGMQCTGQGGEGCSYSQWAVEKETRGISDTKLCTRIHTAHG